MKYTADSEAGKFLHGDEATYAQIVRWIALVLTGPRFRSLRAEWPDLQQEVLGRLLQSLQAGRFDPERDFRVYVQSIARYTARDLVVLRCRMPMDPEKEDAEDRTVDLETRLVEQDLADEALASMSEECREVLKLFYFEHLSYVEIGKKLGIPMGTLKSRLFRCLRKARDDISAKLSLPDGQ